MDGRVGREARRAAPAAWAPGLLPALAAGRPAAMHVPPASQPLILRNVSRGTLPAPPGLAMSLARPAPSCSSRGPSHPLPPWARGPGPAAGPWHGHPLCPCLLSSGLSVRSSSSCGWLLSGSAWTPGPNSAPSCLPPVPPGLFASLGRDCDLALWFGLSLACLPPECQPPKGRAVSHSLPGPWIGCIRGAPGVG